MKYWRVPTDVAALKRRVAQAPTVVWAIAALLPPLAAGGLLLAARHAEGNALALERATLVSLAELRKQAAVPDTTDHTPFAARLPLHQDSARPVAHLREAAEGQGVLVTAIAASQRPATANTLGRMNLDVGLRGGYGAIKTVLSEVLTRDAQQAVLQQISLRRSVAGGAPTFAMASPIGGVRAAGVGDLDVRLVAVWLSRPLSDQEPIAPAGRTPPAAASSSASASASASATSSASMSVPASMPTPAPSSTSAGATKAAAVAGS
jgi:hypothetical protein